jgi:hypothetical protein
MGMLAAAEVFLRSRDGVPPYCAKLYHAPDKRCIFRCRARNLNIQARQESNGVAEIAISSPRPSRREEKSHDYCGKNYSSSTTQEHGCGGI